MTSSDLPCLGLGWPPGVLLFELPSWLDCGDDPFFLPLGSASFISWERLDGTLALWAGLGRRPPPGRPGPPWGLGVVGPEEGIGLVGGGCTVWGLPDGGGPASFIGNCCTCEKNSLIIKHWLDQEITQWVHCEGSI